MIDCIQITYWFSIFVITDDQFSIQPWFYKHHFFLPSNLVLRLFSHGDEKWSENEWRCWSGTADGIKFLRKTKQYALVLFINERAHKYCDKSRHSFRKYDRRIHKKWHCLNYCMKILSTRFKEWNNIRYLFRVVTARKAVVIFVRPVALFHFIK